MIVMEIQSKTQNNFINEFLEKYSEIIAQFDAGGTVYQIGTEESFLFSCSLINDFTPFGKSDNRIAMNATMCAQYDLSDEEKSAMLFHEIGHILINITEDGFEKEHAADKYAIEVGLGEALGTGLQKLIDSGFFPEAEDDMRKRIDAISHIEGTGTLCDKK